MLIEIPTNLDLRDLGSSRYHFQYWIKWLWELLHLHISPSSMALLLVPPPALRLGPAGGVGGQQPPERLSAQGFLDVHSSKEDWQVGNK